MRSFDLDWVEFFEALAMYKQLNVAARSALIVNGPYSAPIRATAFGGATAELLRSGFFEATLGGQTVVLGARFRGFIKALRAMHRSRIDIEPDRHSFDAYLADNFTREEWSSFYGTGSSYWNSGRDGLFSKVTAVKWLEDFLEGNTMQWEAQHRLSLEPAYLGEPQEPEIVKRIIRHLMARTDPEDFEELRKVTPRLPLLAVSIRAGIRYALFYPMLRRDSLLPVLGLWPAIVKRLHRPGIKPPARATPEQSFSAPMFVHEMTAVLTECLAEPLRLLSGGYGELYQKSAARVQARLLSLPEWTAMFVKPNDDVRVRGAIFRLLSMKMLDTAGRPGSDYRMEVLPRGREWLGRPAKERLAGLLDRVRAHIMKKDRERADSNAWEALCEEVRCGPATVDAHGAIKEALTRIGDGGAVRASEFLDYEARSHNPLKSAVQRSAFRRIVVGYSYTDEPSEEQLEEVWTKILTAAIFDKLVPLGALAMGVDHDGFMTIAVTEPGRYLVGLAKDFSFENTQAAAAIVVQANFDVVFMSPSPLAEAELSAFCERRGKHVGEVLKITKKSIWAAASAGIGADQVVERLRSHSSVPIPANVEREIRGWMARCRTATIRHAMLIHCPDEETASRVVAADRAHLTKLTSTVVELSDASLRSKLVRKLRESGIFI